VLCEKQLTSEAIVIATKARAGLARSFDAPFIGRSTGNP
jgi:hypothetical protein